MKYFPHAESQPPGTELWTDFVTLDHRLLKQLPALPGWASGVWSGRGGSRREHQYLMPALLLALTQIFFVLIGAEAVCNQYPCLDKGRGGKICKKPCLTKSVDGPAKQPSLDNESPNEQTRREQRSDFHANSFPSRGLHEHKQRLVANVHLHILDHRKALLKHYCKAFC